MAKQRASWRRLKARRSYDVAEAARAVGVTTATVRAWRKSGLKPIEGAYPTIFRGVDLIAFLRNREKARKQPCGPGRMYCFSCKEPKSPAFGEVEFWPTGPSLGWLRGLCPDCATVMQRRTSRRTLTTAAGNLTVTIKNRDPRLSQTAEPL